MSNPFLVMPNVIVGGTYIVECSACIELHPEDYNILLNIEGFYFTKKSLGNLIKILSEVQVAME